MRYGENSTSRVYEVKFKYCTLYSKTPLNRTRSGPDKKSGLEGIPV